MENRPEYVNDPAIGRTIPFSSVHRFQVSDFSGYSAPWVGLPSGAVTRIRSSGGMSYLYSPL